MFEKLMANMAVTDSARAERWYAQLFGRAPDSRPMPGLIEWQLHERFGVQVWVDNNRAGSSTVVLEVPDLDATAGRLTQAGIEHGGPQPGGGARILQVADPDGNGVVFTGI